MSFTELCQDKQINSNLPTIRPTDIDTFLDKIHCNPVSNLINILQEVQEKFGYLPRYALRGISERTRIKLSRIYGVVTFYAQFYLEPRGKHTILCCRGTACHVKGGARILSTIEQTLSIKDGETTPDMLFYLETVACLGTCFLAPAMMIDNSYYGRLTPDRAKRIIQNYQDNSTP